MWALELAPQSDLHTVLFTCVLSRNKKMILAEAMLSLLFAQNEVECLGFGIGYVCNLRGLRFIAPRSQTYTF